MIWSSFKTHIQTHEIYARYTSIRRDFFFWGNAPFPATTSFAETHPIFKLFFFIFRIGLDLGQRSDTVGLNDVFLFGGDLGGSIAGVHDKSLRQIMGQFRGP